MDIYRKINVFLWYTFPCRNLHKKAGANGNDEDPVRSVYDKRQVKSVGNGMTFRRDLVGIDDIRAAVWALSDTVSSRMRSYGVMCGTVSVAVRDTNLNTVSRQRKLRNPTCFCKDIASVSVDIIRELTDISKPIRSLTVTGMDICKADTVGVQQSFFLFYANTSDITKEPSANRRKARSLFYPR